MQKCFTIGHEVKIWGHEIAEHPLTVYGLMILNFIEQEKKILNICNKYLNRGAKGKNFILSYAEVLSI